MEAGIRGTEGLMTVAYPALRRRAIFGCPAIWPSRESLRKFNHFAFGPATIVGWAGPVAVAFSYERAMPAVAGFNVGNVGIRCDAPQRLRLHANEGIIRRMKNERGHRYPVHHLRRRCPRI